MRTVVILALSVLAGAGCTEPLEVLVEVRSEPDVGPVDRLVVGVYGDDRAAALVHHRTGRFGGDLPQSLTVVADAEGHRPVLRVRATGTFGGLPVGAGDAVVEVSESGRVDVTVTLSRSCLGVSCPRLQRCDPTTGMCDGTCATDTACSGALGCGAGARCERVAEPLGTCVAAAADADGDGVGDARCGVPGDLDCDDTDPGIPAGDPACGVNRDHDCNGAVDDDESCRSPVCSMDGAVIAGRLSRQATLGGSTIVGLGGLRQLPDGWLVIAVRADEIAAVRWTDEGVTESAISVPGVAEARLRGPLFAAATDRGLVLLAIDGAGTLTAIGDPVLTGSLGSVALAGDTAWVGGPGLCLGAVDVRRPEAPRVVQRITTPCAAALPAGACEPRLLATAPAHVLAVTGPHEVCAYPVGPDGAASEATAIGAALSRREDDRILAMVARPARSDGELPLLVIAGENDASFLRMFSFAGPGAVAPIEPADPIADRSLTLGLHVDEAVVAFATIRGAIGARLRDVGGSGLRAGEVVVQGPEGDSLTAFGSVTTSEGTVVVAAAHGTTLRLVELECSVPAPGG